MPSLSLSHTEALPHLQALLSNPTRILILSPAGSGKTSLAHSLLSHYYTPPPHLLSNPANHHLLARQISRASAVLLDNLDLYIPPTSGNQICAGLRYALEGYDGVVVATACGDLNPGLMFEHVISLKPPSVHDRYAYFDGNSVAEITPGASWADLQKVAIARECALPVEPLYTLPQMSKLYGLDHVTAQLEAVLDASFPTPDIRNHVICNKLLHILNDIRTVGGVLLHGPPGVGKTSLLAYAHKYISGRVNVINVSLPDIMHSRVGDSERALSRLFARARSIHPCMLIIENIELLSGRREDDSGVGNRLLGTLLVEMDGIASNGVLVVASATTLDGVDKALLRPGRFDMVLRVDTPDGEARWNLWTDWCNRLQLTADSKTTFVQTSIGWSGGDVISHAQTRWRDSKSFT